MTKCLITWILVSRIPFLLDGYSSSYFKISRTQKQKDVIGVGIVDQSKAHDFIWHVNTKGFHKIMQH